MLKRLIQLPLAAILLSFVLTACSSTPSTLEGSVAYDALVKSVEKSVSALEEKGGSESISTGEKNYVVAFDPSADKGEQVAVVDVDAVVAPTFTGTEVIRLMTLQEIVNSDAIKDAKVEYSDGTFTVIGEQFNITINTKKDLVSEVLLNISDGTNTQSQLFVVTYGVDDYAKKVLSAAAPAPETAQ